MFLLNILCLSAITSSVFIEPSIAQTAPETSDTDDLLFVAVVHRHGQRTSLFDLASSKNSTNPGQTRPREAQLTLEGVRQMYEYGTWIRDRYAQFFDDGSQASSQRIRVISSATDRTITSAQALLAGLLPPNGTNRQWNTPLGSYWYPFPVYSQPNRLDALLLNFGSDCPVFTQLRGNITQLPIAKELRYNYIDLINEIKNTAGITKYDFFETTAEIHDAFLHKPEKNSTARSVPKWVNATIIDVLDRIADIRMHMLVGGNGDRQRTRFRVGVLIDDILRRMIQANDTSTDATKMVLYSGHDENVAGLLAAFGLFNYTLEGPNIGIPKFTSSVILELYKNYTVRALFKNGSSVKNPVILQLPRCKTLCPFNRFEELLKDVSFNYTQWSVACGRPDETLNAVNTIGLSEAIIVAGVLIAASIVVACGVSVWLCYMRRRKFGSR